MREEASGTFFSEAIRVLILIVARQCCNQKKIDPKLLITHRFKLIAILEAYETFANAASTNALKVMISASE